jgi:predicted SnoaL-like aldol condensation-catalyzing enzyme
MITTELVSNETSGSTAYPACDDWTALLPEIDHGSMLTDIDWIQAANKHLVYDFWREVLEAGHLELADTYMTESFVMHNPHIPAGREAFVDFFSMACEPRPIADRVRAPLVGMVADGDFVVMRFASQRPDPSDRSRTETATWFNMFRIHAGKIAEHWDPPQNA